MQELVSAITVVCLLHNGGAHFPISMFKNLLYVIFSSITFSAIAVGQIKPGPTNVVSVLDPSEYSGDLAQQPCWRDPDVQGVLVRQSWSTVEPTAGTFNFSVFDQAIQLARQNGKFVGLDLGAGSLSPDWLYAAGARQQSPVLNLGKGRAPLPWDPVFMEAWSNALEVLGNRYDQDPTVAYVTMSGLGNEFDSAGAAKAGAGELDQADQIFSTQAASNIADIYAACFPHTQLVLPAKIITSAVEGGKLPAAIAGLQAGEPSSALINDTPTLALAVANSTEGLSLASDDELVAVAQAGQLSGTKFMQVRSGVSWAKAAKLLAQSKGASNGVPPISNGQAIAPGDTPSKTEAGTDSRTGDDSTKSATSPLIPPAIVTSAATAAELTTKAWSLARSGQQIWLTAAVSNTSSIGSGTQADPLHVPTSTALDAVLFGLSGQQYGGLIFNFAAGNYFTLGDPHRWAVSTNWQFIGAGQGKTVLALDPAAMVYSGTNKFANFTELVSTNGLGGIVVRDMTLDGNIGSFGSKLQNSFAMPAARGTATVSVLSTAPFKVGKWVYLQDSATTNGRQQYCGLMEVTAISGTQLTLKNTEVAAAGTVTGTLTAGSAVISNISSVANLDEGQVVSGAGIPTGTKILSTSGNAVTLSTPATSSGTAQTISYNAYCLLGTTSTYCAAGNVVPGTTIPATAYVFVASNIGGITAGRTNDTLKNLTVRHVSQPFYEGPAGICMNGFNVCVGGLVQDCTVKDVWGTNAWLISLTDSNGIQLIGNTIIGDGYNQAYSLVTNNSNILFQNNSDVDCSTGFFSDTGTKTNITVTGNTFEGAYPIKLAVAPMTSSSITANTLLVNQSGGSAAMLSLALTNSTFSQNKIQLASGVTSGYGICFNPLQTSFSGNMFSGNVTSSVLQNVRGLPSFGRQSGNVDENGNTVDLGLSN